MRWASVWLSVCLAGCAFEHGQAGEETETGSGSGSGSGSQGQDSDGDGIADATDDCPAVANVDQRDHDDDGRGDACDTCPHLADSDADSDADGVGDACDPHPTEAGDRIAFFEGFYDPVAWHEVIGPKSWQQASGELRQIQLDEPSQIVRDDNPNPGTVFVDARVRVNAMSSDTAVRRSAGVVLGYGDPKHYFFCGLAAATQGSEINVGEVYTDFFGTAQYSYAPGAFAASMSGDWLTIQARTRSRDGTTTIECSSRRAEVTGTATFSTDADAGGDIGVRTNGTDASFDYVFVVEVPASSS
ncbi:MAG: hypothetical protein HOV81_01465 [Kofleriaceae bacterium]|nr:hypothetical protein [Kofleriaceae bacterium]